MSLRQAKQKILEARLGDVSSWSPAGRERTMEALRPFDLRQGEELPVAAGANDTLCYLVQGEARISINKSPFLPLPSSAPTPHAVAVPQGSHAVILAHGDCQLICADEEELDFLASWETLQAAQEMDSDEDILQRLGLLRNPLVFRHLPFANVMEALRRMHPRREEANEIVIAEGDPADAFYIIESGTAEVWRSPAPGKPQVKVAVLGVGDAFGEEALITGETRNATVRMTRAGVLLRLSRDDFADLIEQPLLHEVDLATARRLVDEGFIPLDVGYQAEPTLHMFSRKALAIPLAELRQRLPELSPDGCYLAFCSIGRLGAVAAMLLRERGIEAVSLAGGIKEWLPQGAPDNA